MYSWNDQARAETLLAVRAYHQRTKHLPDRFAPGPGYMDWANQPDPFRRFRGTRLIELPLVHGPESVHFSSLIRPTEVPPHPLTLNSLSLFLELSLGLTAWKQLGGSRWALRSNPSSGNLHPTEGYVLLPPVKGVSTNPGVYHYASYEHALEERCVWSDTMWAGLMGGSAPLGFLVGMSSVHWRETWKYGERAYRYCQHDAGHALGSLRYSAAVLGWSMRLVPEPSDADLATIIGVNRAQDFVDAEPEFPDFLAMIIAGQAPPTNLHISNDAVRMVGSGSWRGRANILSPERVDWPGIAAIEANAVKPRTKHRVQQPGEQERRNRGTTLAANSADPSAVSIIRQRRSAVAMDGRTSVSLDSFMGMLARIMPDPGSLPWDAFPFPARILPCLFVHRVDGLEPGLYALMRDPARLGAFRAACHHDFLWTRISGSHLPLYELRRSDMRQVAAYVSCTQDIAGDGAFSLGMIADFSRTLKEEGAWAYRRLFWEAGLIGQVLYLEAEAAGVQATGIGCYFDDLMHRNLGLDLEDDAWQSLYHFTVGGAVQDSRLMTLPAYFHLPGGKR